VIATSRREQRLLRLQKELGDLLHPLVLDVRDRSAVNQAFATLPSMFAKVDLSVNNAGLSVGLESRYEADLSEREEMIDTNCKALTYCTHVVLPGKIHRKRGHIINMGSIAAEFPDPGGNVYGATKAFVPQFSMNLRADLPGSPIRVIDIEPGLCGGSEFSIARFRGYVARAGRLYRGVQALTAADIADVVFCSATLPIHVNVNRVQRMPVQQAFGSLAVYPTLPVD
jgi:3-hydroxy acid dehydrogenase / malonic semialdehyde reductase